MKRYETFAALRHRNYRLWFRGQLVSLFGTWMQTTAQGYLIYELTHSSAYLGYIAFASGLPTWLFMLYGGVVADRVSRRRVLIISQASMMLLALVLAGLTFSGLVQAWHILGLAFLLGVANAFDAPARLAFTLEMVNREDLANAVALNAAMFNAATALGPAAGGMIYAMIGPGWCFTVNGLSFVAIIVALLMMQLPPNTAPVSRASTWADLSGGIRYVANEPAARGLIALVGLTSLFGVSVVTLLPAWATDVLGGDATTNGLLLSARGMGALVGALLIASLGRFTWRGKLLTVGSFVFPAVTLLFALVRWLPLSLLALMGAGMAQILVGNLSNVLLQTLAPDALRGRVMSIFSTVFFGFMPIGGLLAGTLAEYIGEPAAVMVNAAILLGIAALLRWRVPRLYALQ